MVEATVLAVAYPPEALIVVAGEFDLSNHDKLTDAASVVMEEGCRRLLFDLGRVTFLDASSLGALVGIRNQLARTGGTVRLIGVGTSQMKLLRATQLGESFGVVDAG